MSPAPQRLLVALALASGVLLASLALLIGRDPGRAEVAAAAPSSRSGGRPPLEIDAGTGADPASSTGKRSGITSRRVLCRGRVLGDFGLAAPSVPIELGVDTPDGGAVLAHAASDPRGQFLCEVPVPEDVADAPDAFVFARVERAGYARRIVRRPISKLDREVVIHLSLSVLHALPGNVVDRDGAPVKHALVELRTPDLPGVDASAWTEEDGTFEMLWSRPGTYRLSAKAQGKGSATMAPIVLDADVEPEPLKVVLERSDVLAGRVEDTEGHPIGKEELWAFPASLAGSSAERLFEWRMSEASGVSDGERSGSTTSAEDGSFHFQALAPGAYFVAPRTELDETTVAARVWRTGDLDVRVVLERWRLEIRGPEGIGGRLFCAGIFGGRAGRALPVLEPGSTAGSQVFQVEGGRSYLCGWVEPRHEVAETVVLVPWDRPRTIVEIPETASADPGNLSITLATLDRDDARRKRIVRVSSAASGFELWRWDQTGESLGAGIPPGAYVLRVELEPTRSFRDGTPGFETLLVDERRIEIRAGETTKLDLWR